MFSWRDTGNTSTQFLADIDFFAGIDVGVPTNTRSKNANGIWVRNFTKCEVRVNPHSTEVREGMSGHSGKITVTATGEVIYYG